MSDNIKVVVKIRPLISREIENKLQYQWRVNNNTLFQLDSNGKDFGQSFTFDKVYDENTNTTDVYNDVAKPIVEAAVAGFNGTIFAYGQTSSGKTYTMSGTDESPGIIPLAVLNLFDLIKNVPGRDFVVSVSYIEIYNESVRDLLNINKKNIKIHETYHGTIKLDAEEKVTASTEEVLEAMKVGNANRQTGSTNMNENSSRSHSLFQISIESREHYEGDEQTGDVNVSQLNLVDLAGSERAGQTGATGIRFKEGTLINKSLLSLTNVIKQLSEEPNRYINYRDSKLTRILQNSLGGNAKTSIICAITPAALEETISTLQFATRAKTIKNKPEVNAVATDATMIQKLTKELSALQSQLKTKKDLEFMLESKKTVEQDLQKKIANLQRFILNGFGERPNVEVMGGARRRLIPPRRVTISTLHSIEEDVPKVPKFCTPSLKYNPALIQNPDFPPIQEISKLSSLPEEPPRMVTPPPNEKKVNFSDEVIQLDSDDEADSNAHLCSPYHKCYDSSKTPPCVLRKNAKHYEKNFKDLVELTDREKMYEPSVVELIEKIEKSTTETAKLRDEIETLKSVNKEKDSEIELLRSKICHTEEEIKNFSSVTLELETQRKVFNTKLTDWEVSYETLKSKAKLREQELLSLIEEQKMKQTQDVGKMPPFPKDIELNNFMDMSKDISLVHSDNENSGILSQEEEIPECIDHLIKDLQMQLESKNQIIQDLNCNIVNQKEQIETLEKSISELTEQVNGFKAKLNDVQHENEQLQATVRELNSTIKSQKENLDSVLNDTNPYISSIQELQFKLTNKENLRDVHITEDILETMLASEDKIISNNDNLKNIILSFKLALNNSKTEVDALKSKIQIINKTGDQDLKTKTEQIDLLHEEMSKLKKQISEHMLTINALVREKSDLALIEQELVKKISDVEEKNHELYRQNKDNALVIENLKRDNGRIVVLEHEIKMKDTIMEKLKQDNEVYQISTNKAKEAIKKLQDVFSILTGEVREVPEILDSFISIFNNLNNNLNILETVALEMVTQKELAHKNNIELQNKIDSLVLQNTTNVHELTKQTELLNESLQNNRNKIAILTDRNSELLIDIENLNRELNNKNKELYNLESQFKTIQKSEYNLRRDILEKDKAISVLKENELHLAKTKNELKLKQDTSHNLTSYDTDMNNTFKEESESKSQLVQVQKRLHESEKANEHFIDTMVQKLSSILEDIRVNDKYFMNSFVWECGKKQENILLLLNAVGDQVLMLLSIEVENKELRCKIEKLLENERNLNHDLKQSSSLLIKLQEELQTKVTEFGSIEHKAKEMKEQFINFDVTMKEQMQFLQLENEKLKARCLDFEKRKEMQLISHTIEDHESIRKNYPKEFKAGTGTEVEDLSPPSLITICCNTISNAIVPKQDDNLSIQNSPNINIESPTNTCSSCKEFHLELHMTQIENIKLMEALEQLEFEHKELLKDHNEVRNEVRLLIEPAQKLQKKILNHRTNLSILTATTFAENKSLKSQVKGLQHHHSRFHNVCQRDIPAFKKQLNELLAILRDDSSFCDTLYFNDKRYSLSHLLDKNSSINQFRNESTFDGDLMLDTNVTLTTSDTTLAGYNQTCLDSTMNETVCQTTGHDATEANVLSNELDIWKSDTESFEILKEENRKLKEQLMYFLNISKSTVDAPSSPIRFNDNDDIFCKKCRSLTEHLLAATREKEHIEKKYNEFILEMPSKNALIDKIKEAEADYYKKDIELLKTTDILNEKCKALKALQDENDLLSTQVMEHISEADDLGIKLKKIKQENIALADRLNALEKINSQKKCTKCCLIDEMRSETISDDSNHSKLNRSLSDSNKTSRQNKICTLQSEIHAGREDCQKLTEEVATIKQHLEHTDKSIELDESMTDLSVFTLANDMLPERLPTNQNKMPHIQEERSLDIYIAEKMECFNYYLDTIGGEKDSTANNNMKIIEIMKLLHLNLVTAHGTEVENLMNKLQNYNERQEKLQETVNKMEASYSKIKNDLEEKEKSINIITYIITELKENLRLINVNEIDSTNTESNSSISKEFKEKFLSVLDKNFNLCCVSIFEQLCQKQGYVLNNNEKQLVVLQNEIAKQTAELESARDIATKLKCTLSEKEKEYALLQQKNKKIHEINNAVTLNIILNNKEIHKLVTETYQKMIKHDLIDQDKVILKEPLNSQSLVYLLEHVIIKYQKEKAQALELQNCMMTLERKEKEFKDLYSQTEHFKSINMKNKEELYAKDCIINNLELKQNELQESMKTRVKENAEKLTMIDSLTQEINKLKEKIANQESYILSLSDKAVKATELLNAVRNLQDENNKLKAVNDMIRNEKELYASELEKSCATIKQNNIDFDKMTSDILVLRESMKEATAHVAKLKNENMLLSKENVELKQECEVKTRECSRLEINIKTHEKTAEIQSRMIMRLQKLKEEDEKSNNEKLANANELIEKYKNLQNECESMKNALKNSVEEMENLKIAKESLQARLSELEEGRRSRLSSDVIADASKRRRQSLHDSKRLFEEHEEHKNLEAVFESRHKSDELFFDVDQDSGRSTPFGLGKERDSMLSKTDCSDKDEEHPSRPSSVAATRRRRQSLHDLHRSVTPHATSPHDLSNYVINELEQLETTRNRLTSDNEITQLRSQLTSCKQELEDLKERYRELDEECETCAEYLRERDEQCLRLKKEKTALENQVMELKRKIDMPGNTLVPKSKPSVSHVSVNTDEDWTNLHDVVVDRMSYDAEVEKNKKLTKTIEELRYTKQDLKNTLAKMQKALEKNSAKDNSRELEQTKQELRSCKEELSDLRMRYKELDEECETCAKYLKEREEQCRRLKEAKTALEGKLQELQEDSHALELTKTVRKKRQTIHDMNRPETSIDQSDACTETTDDILSFQVERDDSSQGGGDQSLRDVKSLIKMVEKLSHQKSQLEQQLKSINTPAHPMFVATGSAIVQNQQITDVMKENQRLKKMNAKLVNICKKRGKSANRENEDPCDQG